MSPLAHHDQTGRGKTNQFPLAAEVFKGVLSGCRIPEQIAGQLLRDFADDMEGVTHEMTDQAPYVHSCGELRRDGSAAYRPLPLLNRMGGDRSHNPNCVRLAEMLSAPGRGIG